MNQRMRIVTMYLPRKRIDPRLFTAIVLFIIAGVMVGVMALADMNIKAYQPERWPVTVEVRP